jgi:peptidoglycan hydrolase CwlO-like protein
MMDKLVRALFSQRAHLLEAQYTSTERVAEMEQRLVKIQELLQARLNAYEKRVGDLERQLTLAQEENRDLMRAKFHLAKKVVELQARQQTRVDLRDAGFLLRA